MSTELGGIVEEAPSGSGVGAPGSSPPTAHHHHSHHHAQVDPHKKRRNSSVSHVDVDFFDPAGMQELKRTLTTQSRKETEKARQEHKEKGGNNDDGLKTGRRSSESSTLFPEDQPFDFVKAMKKALRRRDEDEVKPRVLGVGFRDLRVVGKSATDSYMPTFGSFFDPRVILEQWQKSRHPTLKNILSDFEGVVKPGEMLLVLGSPGSGCTTLLKMLANQRKEYHAVYGDVHFDNFTPEEIHKQFRGDILYCPEDDVHFPTLTVQQTLNFAATCRTPRNRAAESREAYAETIVQVLETVFGLRHVTNTRVGDNAIRGVSGGEKKRVSIAEALASRSCITAWDNSTRGLDSSTALEFVKALRLSSDVFDMASIFSIYQAGESLFEHFDKVCVVYEGRMAYFGPANEARQYFLDMGYEPANRQTTPDFLVAVTDANARIPRAGFSNQPRSAEEFAAYFLKSEHGKRNRAEVEQYISEHSVLHEKKNAFIESAHAEFAKRSAKTSPYLLSTPQQVQAVMRRRVQILRGNMLATGLNLFSFVFQGLIMGTVFFQSKETTGAFFSRGGTLFFAVLFSALSAMAEIPALFAQRPIVSRHEKSALYHPFVEALALTLVDVPITVGIMSVFAVIVYFMVGLQKTAAQFFTFFLLVLTLSLTMKGFFRSIAAFFVSEAASLAFAGFCVLITMVYTGFAIPKPSMIGALRWLTYINPVRYGFEAVMANEFHTLHGLCTNLVPQGPGYENVSLANQVCTTVGAQPGQAFVDGNRFLAQSYGFFWSKTWMNLGIIIAFGVGFTVALLIFAEYNTSVAMERSVTLFMRKRKPNKARTAAIDEEKGATVHDEKADTTVKATTKPSATFTPPTMTDIFSWQHINYTVPIPGKADRRLLSDVSGYVAPGKITALMGESGAGKTTLLNVLAERTDVGVVTGDRFVKGQGLPHDFQAQTGYCQQLDTHVPFSTVREALLFSAKLRQPSSVPLDEKEAYVEKCLQMCGLEAYADATVGSLSVEHRKRTTIAVELAAKPKLLLFLDEPTSGLDSQSAWAIVSFLRTLAESGQAILCTIHQPSAELFQVFDRLLLLKKGGETVYFGDLGDRATSIISYFERNGARKCQPAENPAEYMLDVIGAGATATSEQDWYSVWQKSPEAEALQDKLEEIHEEGRRRPPVEASLHTEFATSWFFQFKELMKRDSQAHWRDATYLLAKVFLNVSGGLFIGFTFFKTKNTEQVLQNQLFAIFMTTVLTVPLSNQIQVPFINMRRIYEIRERSSRMYSWSALVSSQVLAEIPWNIFGASLMFVSWYWTVGFPTSRAGYTYLVMGVVLPLYYTTFSQAVACMASTAEIAGIIFTFLFSFVITFNGVLQPYRQLGWWKWMYHVSPFTYLIEGLLGQAMGGEEVTCSAVELVTLNPPSGQTCGQYMANYISFAGGYLTNPSATNDCGFCSIRSSDQFLGQASNIFYKNHWRDFGLLLAYVAANFMFIFLLTYFIRIRKGSLIPFKK